MSLGIPSGPPVNPGFRLATSHEEEHQLANGLYLVNDPSSSLWRQAARTEAEIFKAKGYVQSAIQLSGEYMSYLPMSSMMVAVENDEVPACIRFIDYSPYFGFKTLNDAQPGKPEQDRLVISGEGYAILDGIELSECVEVGTISVEKSHRRMSVPGNEALIFSLYGAIFKKASENGTPNIIASFDEDYLMVFEAMFGSAVKRLGPASKYMGSMTVPVIMNVHEIISDLRSSGENEFANMLTSGGFVDRTVSEEPRWVRAVKNMNRSHRAARGIVSLVRGSSEQDIN